MPPKWGILFLLAGAGAAFGGARVPAQGPGCTTATMIDWDCDGYGPGSPLGPDADDRDPGVNTSATALARYGDTKTLLEHLGYHPQRILYIANGGDGKGRADNESRPYRSWDQVAHMVKAGDAVVWRAGTYPDHPVLETGGKPDKPILLMAYPGEKVILDQRLNGIEFVSQSNIVIDGLILENTGNGLGESIFFGDPAVNITIRNVELRKRGRGVLGMNGLANVLIERSVIHDTTEEHCIYLGAREKPNRDITVRQNVLYNGGYTGFQHNGRVTHMLVDSNIIHSNVLAALSFAEGVSDSVVSNNLMYGNGRNCMVLFDYPGDPNANIRPYDQKNIDFVNNTCWVGAVERSGAPISQPAINVDDGGFPVSMDGLKFENNIFVTQSYAIFKFGQAKHLETSVIRNNVMFNAGGSAGVRSGDAELGFAAVNGRDALKSGNLERDPLFQAVRTGWYNAPENYDFTLRSGSPALGFSIPADAPAADLTGRPRGSAPDAGAYQSRPASGPPVVSAKRP